MKTLYALLIICALPLQLLSSELFVRVNASGFHYATAENQTQYNLTNIFRFFDLNSGNITLNIKKQGSNQQVCNRVISLAANTRVIVEVDGFGNFIVIQTQTIQQINWYTTQVVGQYSGGSIGNNTTSNDASFQEFLKLLKNESFDSNRLKEVSKYVTKMQVSAAQVADMCRTFTFDSNRLEAAKQAYASCYDKGNYFLLKEVFTYSSNYRELEEYIEKQ